MCIYTGSFFSFELVPVPVFNFLLQNLKADISIVVVKTVDLLEHICSAVHLYSSRLICNLKREL